MGEAVPASGEYEEPRCAGCRDKSSPFIETSHLPGVDAILGHHDHGAWPPHALLAVFVALAPGLLSCIRAFC